MKLFTSYYTHKSIPDAKLEAGSSSSFREIMSQSFPRKKGMSHQIRLFTPGKRVSLLKSEFLCGIVLLDPKLSPRVNFRNFQAEENFFIL